MNSRRLGLGGSRFAWALNAVALAGIVAGMVFLRPLESARAAQQPPTADQEPASSPTPLPFPGAQPPPTEENASTDDAAAAGDTETEPAPPIAARTFDAPAAMVINYVQAGSASGFESLTRRMVEALAASEDAEHRALAAGWTMYRVSEPPGPNNNAVYVWLFDPVVDDANYAVAQLLNQVFPEEVQQLYETYMESFGMGQTPLELEPVELVEDPG
jgi:hypothetical protein